MAPGFAIGPQAIAGVDMHTFATAKAPRACLVCSYRNESLLVLRSNCWPLKRSIGMAVARAHVAVAGGFDQPGSQLTSATEW